MFPPSRVVSPENDPDFFIGVAYGEESANCPEKIRLAKFRPPDMINRMLRCPARGRARIAPTGLCKQVGFMNEKYECVIGLEIHIQLLTNTKMFCGCRNRFSHEPNTNVCPVCLGQPGTLPVINKQALEFGIRGGLAINCAIPPLTKFDRKHYYYPDLPKNIQISQFDLPVCIKGWLEVETESGLKTIGITRAHLEEDAGKLIHAGSTSNVDLNRTGTPLLEVVTEPDIRTPQEARAFLDLLRQTMLYAGITDGNMEEGSLRCDANISVRPYGETKLGVKNEIKNMNSFRGVENALEMVYVELCRQMDEKETIQQVTWGYNLEKQKIFQMRIKEDSNDYRYFPEPDLPPLHIAREWVEEIRRTLPELPQAKRARFEKELGLQPAEAGLLVQDRALAEYFEEVVKAGGAAKEAANWVLNDVARDLNERGGTADAYPVTAGALAELIGLLAQKKINMPTARKIFAAIIGGDSRMPAQIVVEDGLGQVSDSGAIKAALAEAMEKDPKATAEMQSGETRSAMWFVGQIMQQMKGQADPQAITEVIAGHFGIDPQLLQSKKKKKK